MAAYFSLKKVGPGSSPGGSTSGSEVGGWQLVLYTSGEGSIPYGAIMHDFDTIIAKFKSKEMDVGDWNFCIDSEGGTYGAYVMGEGSQQCLACKQGFSTREEIVSLFESLGVKRILRGVG